MTARVRVRAAGIDELLDTPAAKALVTGGAKQVAESASELAPVDTGYYKRSLRSSRAVREPDRLVATAYTVDPFGHLVEWGSVNNPAHAPLRRGAERLGLRTRVATKGGG